MRVLLCGSQAKISADPFLSRRTNRQAFQSELITKLLFQRSSDVVGLLRFRRLEGDHRPTGEVDVIVLFAASKEGNQTDSDHDQRNCTPENSVFQEVDIRFADQLTHVQLLQPTTLFSDIKDQTTDKQHSVHADGETQKQSDSKPLDLVGTNCKQNHGCQQRGDVRIKNGDERFLETVLNGHSDAGTLGEFFSHTFVDQNVGIHRHPDCQHDPCDTWQRESRVDCHHSGNCQQQIQHQRDYSHDTGESVVDQHEDHNGQTADQRRVYTFVSNVSSQSRVDCRFAERLGINRNFQSTRVQNVGQFISFDPSKSATTAGNLTSICDLFINVRSTENCAVQHDCQLAARHTGLGSIPTCELPKQVSAGLVERKADDDRSVLIEVRGSRTQILAGDAFFFAVHQQQILFSFVVFDFPVDFANFLNGSTNGITVQKLRQATFFEGWYPTSDHVTVQLYNRLRLIQFIGEANDLLIGAVGADEEFQTSKASNLSFDFIHCLRIFARHDDFNSIATHFTDSDFFRTAAINTLADGPDHSIHHFFSDLFTFRLYLKHHVCSTTQIDPQTEPFPDRLAVQRGSQKRSGTHGERKEHDSQAAGPFLNLECFGNQKGEHKWQDKHKQCCQHEGKTAGPGRFRCGKYFRRCFYGVNSRLGCSVCNFGCGIGRLKGEVKQSIQQLGHQSGFLGKSRVPKFPA